MRECTSHDVVTDVGASKTSTHPGGLYLDKHMHNYSCTQTEVQYEIVTMVKPGETVAATHCGTSVWPRVNLTQL